MSIAAIQLPEGPIRAFCTRWKIVELALFGSSLRDDFHAGSDIDILAAFAPNDHRSLLDEAQMELELEAMLGRKVDLVSRTAVEKSHNWIRRKAILDSAVRVYDGRTG